MGKERSERVTIETASGDANESNKRDKIETFDSVQVKAGATVPKASTNTTSATTPTLKITDGETDASTDSNLDAKATSPDVSKPLKLDAQTTSRKKDDMPVSPTKVEMTDTSPAVDVKSSGDTIPSRTDVAKDKDESKSIEKVVPASNVSEEVGQNQPTKEASTSTGKGIPIANPTAPTTRTEDIETPKLDPKPDAKRRSMPKLETTNTKNDILTESARESVAKDGIQSLTDLFFGSTARAGEQDDAAVMARIKSRKQEKKDER